MKQPHTESGIDHVEGQQNTGNHRIPKQDEVGGSDRLGGTRAGAENIEKKEPDAEHAKDPRS